MYTVLGRTKMVLRKRDSGDNVFLSASFLNIKGRTEKSNRYAIAIYRFSSMGTLHELTEWKTS